MYYIHETDKLKFITKQFNIIKSKGNNLILPIQKLTPENQKTNTETQKTNSKKVPQPQEKQQQKIQKREQKLAEKTSKIVHESNSKKIVISKELQKHTTYLNSLYTYDLDIVNGKWLFLMLLPETVKYIVDKQKLQPEQTAIHILVNDINSVIISNIKILANIYKSINIVTKHVEKLNKIEEQILETSGAMITVMNNKKKSLAKAQIIINIDFPSEIINQYAICENATIIDMCGKTKITKKRFNGVVIQDYEIEIKNKREYTIDEDYYYQKDLYEAEFYKQQPFEYVREKIKKDGVKIVKLISQRGVPFSLKIS